MIIPPSVAIANLVMAVWLVSRPKRILQVVYSAFIVAIAALSLPAWYYTLRASQSPDILLIDIFPPISSFLIILIVLVMVMLPPRRAFPIMVVAWVSNALAERLCNAVNSDLFPPVGKLTASGGATSRRENDTLETLIARADKALYQAKLAGRDRVVCG